MVTKREVVVDMDCASDSAGRLPPGNYLADKHRRSEFDRGKFRVQEIVFSEWGPGVDKLVWCRPPFENLIVAGIPNPCFHTNFPHGDAAAEEEARRAVAEEFDRRAAHPTFGIVHRHPAPLTEAEDALL